MAIEREAGAEVEVSETESETVDIPASMLAGNTVKPGDVIRLEVVANDDDMGTVTVKYAMPEEAESGIGEMAEAFA